VQAKAEPIRLPKNNTGLRMLMYIRDEAHRFASAVPPHFASKSTAGRRREDTAGARRGRGKAEEITPARRDRTC